MRIPARLQVLDRDGARVTPFYASDNYLTVLPGQSRLITVATPAAAIPVRWR